MVGKDCSIQRNVGQETHSRTPRWLIKLNCHCSGSSAPRDRTTYLVDPCVDRR